MTETLNELRVLEDEFIEIRCRLRQLQGRVGIFVDPPHPVVSEYMRNPNDLAAADMLNLITLTVGKLDQYENKKGYRFERCNAWERIHDTAQLTSKLERCKHGHRIVVHG